MLWREDDIGRFRQGRHHFVRPVRTVLLASLSRLKIVLQQAARHASTLRQRRRPDARVPLARSRPASACGRRGRRHLYGSKLPAHDVMHSLDPLWAGEAVADVGLIGHDNGEIARPPQAAEQHPEQVVPRFVTSALRFSLRRR